MTILTETRERFLLAITAQIPPERIAEIHFFQPIRQGGVESGVAVAAAWPEAIPQPATDPSPSTAPDESPADSPAESPAESLAESPAESLAESPAESTIVSPEDVVERLEPETRTATAVRDVRPVIYTARYRLILKGLDRGKWETMVVAEADAPLVTVDVVVRGVQRRSGDADDATRMEGDDVRAFVATYAARPRK